MFVLSLVFAVCSAVTAVIVREKNYANLFEASRYEILCEILKFFLLFRISQQSICSLSKWSGWP